MISSWLRRAAGNIQQNLTEIVADVKPKGPQVLPLGLRGGLFDKRMDNILRGECRRPMTPKWMDHIFSKHLRDWAFILSRGIPGRVQSIPGSLTARSY